MISPFQPVLILRAPDQFVNQQLLVKISQSFVANLTNRVTKAGPMSEAIALGHLCILRLALTSPAPRHFNGASE
jgi:hypothetical protein